jgi:hypothetical protein
MAWLTDARLDRARELLELTDEPVENLGRLTGLGSSASVRAIFTGGWASHPTTTGRCSGIAHLHERIPGHRVPERSSLRRPERSKPIQSRPEREPSQTAPQPRSRSTAIRLRGRSSTWVAASYRGAIRPGNVTGGE